LRPAWFFRRQAYGGILVDIASRQFDQFLFFTGADNAEIIAARVANINYPCDPGSDDLGGVLLATNHGSSGYIRVDWYAPAGLSNSGDGRLFIIGPTALSN
jgi:predicted dehydrogenase